MHATMRLLSIKWLKKVAGPVMNPRHPPQFHPGTLEITPFLLLLLHRGSNPGLLETIPQTLPLYHQQITLLLSKKTNHQQIKSMEGLKVPPHYTGKQSPYNILLQFALIENSEQLILRNLSPLWMFFISASLHTKMFLQC